MIFGSKVKMSLIYSTFVVGLYFWLGWFFDTVSTFLKWEKNNMV